MRSLDDGLRGKVDITTGSSTEVIAAQAGFKIYVTDLHVYNTSAGVVTVDLRDGVSGSVVWSVIVPAGGGIVHAFAYPLGGFSVNTALCADPSAAASTVTVNISGFKSKI